MSALDAGIARKIKAAEEIQFKAKRSIRAPINLGIVPLVPAPFNILLGAIMGLNRARLEKKYASMRMAFDIDDRYQLKQAPENGFIDRIVLGIGMELGWYKSGLIAAEKESGSMSAEQKKAYFVDQLPNMSPVCLMDDIATRHIVYLGQTGVGKTEAMLASLKQSVERGGGGIIFEAKGEEIAGQRAYEICEAAGVEHKFRYISFEDKALSHTYNPFVGDNIRALTSTATKLQKEGGEPFFDAVSYSGLSAAIILLSRQKDKKPFNFRDIQTIFVDPSEFLRLHETMAGTTEDEKIDQIYISRFLQGFVSYNNKGQQYFNADKWQTFFAGVIAAINPFCNSNYGAVVNSYDPDIELRKCIENNEVLVVSISSLADSKGASLFGQIFLADLARAIGEIQVAGTKPYFVYPVWLDEYASFKHEHHQQLFQLARSANISLAISVQGINFLKQESEEFAKNVVGQCWTSIFYDIKDPDTRELAAAFAGTVIREFEQTSEGTNTGQSHDSTGSGSTLYTKSEGKSVSSGTKAMREELIQPEDMMLDAGDALIIGKNETYRVRMPIIEFDNEPVHLSEKTIVRFDRGLGRGLNLYHKKGSQTFSHLL